MVAHRRGHFGKARLFALLRYRARGLLLFDFDAGDQEFKAATLLGHAGRIIHALLAQTRLQGLASGLINARPHLRIGPVGALQCVPDRSFKSVHASSFSKTHAQQGAKPTSQHAIEIQVTAPSPIRKSEIFGTHCVVHNSCCFARNRPPFRGFHGIFVLSRIPLDRLWPSTKAAATY